MRLSLKTFVARGCKSCRKFQCWLVETCRATCCRCWRILFYFLVSKYRQYFISFCHKARMWETDRRTDRRTEGTNYNSHDLVTRQHCCIVRSKSANILQNYEDITSWLFSGSKCITNAACFCCFFYFNRVTMAKVRTTMITSATIHQMSLGVTAVQFSIALVCLGF